MSDVTVAQFAEVLKVPVDRLLVQLESAGIQVAGPQAFISDEAKLELLTHLRRAHGQRRGTPQEDLHQARCPRRAEQAAPGRSRRKAQRDRSGGSRRARTP